jgi:hypothetical protein
VQNFSAQSRLQNVIATIEDTAIRFALAHRTT